MERMKLMGISVKTGLLMFLLVIIGVQDIQHALTIETGDFLHYWTTAQFEMKRHPGSLYSLESEGFLNDFSVEYSGGLCIHAVELMRGERPFVAMQSPFLYSMIGYLSTDDYDHDERIFHEISFACLLAGLALLIVRLDYGLDELLILAIFVLYAFFPVIQDDVNSNVNRIEFFLLALSLLCLGTRAPFLQAAGSALLGAAVMLKMNMLPIVPLLFLLALQRKDVKRLRWQGIGFLAGLFAAFMTGSMFMRSFSWVEWLQRVASRRLWENSLSDGNYSLPSLLFSLTGWDLSIPVLVIGLVLVAVRLRGSLRTSAVGDDRPPLHLEQLRLAAAGCLVWILCFPLVWSHYYTLTLPMVVYVLRPGFQSAAGAGKRLAAFTAIAALAMPLYLTGAGMSFAATGWMSWSAALVLFLLGTGTNRVVQDELVTTGL